MPNSLVGTGCLTIDNVNPKNEGLDFQGSRPVREARVRSEFRADAPGPVHLLDALASEALRVEFPEVA